MLYNGHRHAYATEIVFKATSENKEVDFNSGLSNHVDLFSGVERVGNITLRRGTYEEVKFKAELASHGNEPSFELTGVFSNGNISSPITFRINKSFEIETEKSNVVVTANKKYLANTLLNLSMIIKGVG